MFTTVAQLLALLQVAECVRIDAVTVPGNTGASNGVTVHNPPRDVSPQQETVGDVVPLPERHSSSFAAHGEYLESLVSAMVRKAMDSAV